MKKRIAFVCFGICLMVSALAVFFYRRQSYTDMDVCYSEFSWEMCSSKGIFFFEDGYLSFADAESGKRVLICNTASCTHEKKDCPSAFDSSLVYGVTLADNKLIYLSNEGIKDQTGFYLYTSDINGTNRKKEAYIPDVEMVLNVVINQKRAIISYQNRWDENARELDVPEAGVYVYDFETKKGKKIYQIKKQNVLISRLQEMDDGVVLSQYYSDLTKEEIVDNATNEEETGKHNHSELVYIPYTGTSHKILSDDVELASFLKVSEDDIYYVKDNQIFCSKTDGSRKKVDYTVPDGENISLKPVINQNGFLIQGYRKETDDFHLEYFDIASQKSKDYGSSEVSVIAQYDKYTYVNIPSRDGETKAGYLPTEALKDKKWEKAKVFGTEYLTQIKE